jgi:hypothetical protein
VSVKFSGDTLLGNFSFAASEINASDPITGAFVGTIPIDDGAGHTPGGLWSPSGPGAPPEEAPTREAEEDWDGDGGGCCSKVACHGWRCGVEAGSFADAVAVRQSIAGQIAIQFAVKQLLHMGQPTLEYALALLHVTRACRPRALPFRPDIRRRDRISGHDQGPMAGQHIRFCIRDPGLRACVRSGIGLFGGSSRNRLQDHIDGKVALSISQVRAIDILLKKIVPDLRPMSMSAKLHSSVCCGNSAAG